MQRSFLGTRPTAPLLAAAFAITALAPVNAQGFSQPTLAFTATRPLDLCIADINGDGLLDALYCGDGNYCNCVEYSLGTPGGGFSPAVQVPHYADNPKRSAFLDMDGDGSRETTWLSSSGKVYWSPFLPNGSYGAVQSTQLPISPENWEEVDVDSDDTVDLLVSGHSRVGYLPRASDGSLGSWVTVLDSLGSWYTDAQVADVSGDGLNDLLLTDDATDSVHLCLGIGAGQFAGPVTIGVSLDWPTCLAAADLDADGDLDVVVGARGDGVLLLENLGQGAFGVPAVLEGSAGTDPVDVGVHDLNLDGALDVVAVAAWQDRVSWWQGGDMGSFGPALTVTDAPDFPVAFAVADLTGDTMPDLLIAAELGYEVTLSANEMLLDCDGNGVHDPQDIINGQSGDCDNDGVPDECEADCNGNGVSDACEILGGAVADCDRDGTPDSCQIEGSPSLDWDGDGVLDACAPPQPVYCVGNTNSTGQVGSIEFIGSPIVGANDFTIRTANLPTAAPAYYVFSFNTGFVNPFGGGDGVLCLGAPIRRFNPTSGYSVLFSNAAGEVNFTPDLTAMPAIGSVVPGDLIHFQLWHREFDASGSPTSNTSSAGAVMFR